MGHYFLDTLYLSIKVLRILIKFFIQIRDKTHTALDRAIINQFLQLCAGRTYFKYLIELKHLMVLFI